jgi:hypothetical protein
MKRIQESVAVLGFLNEDLRNRDEAIIQHKLHFSQFQTGSTVDHQHFMSLFNLSLINIKGYMDEYDRWFGVPPTEAEYIERVKKLKKCLHPLASFVRKWKGIEEFRNEYLAHNMRHSRTKGLTLLEASFEQLLIPNDFAELFLITNTIHLMTRVINMVFTDEVQEAARIIKKRSDSMSGTMSRPLVSIGEAKDTLVKLVTETNEYLSQEYELELSLNRKDLERNWDRLNLRD